MVIPGLAYGPALFGGRQHPLLMVKAVPRPRQPAEARVVIAQPFDIFSGRRERVDGCKRGGVAWERRHSLQSPIGGILAARH